MTKIAKPLKCYVHSELEGLLFPFRAWTDYPMIKSENYKRIPPREIDVLSYDGNKYCQVRFLVSGIKMEMENRMSVVWEGDANDISEADDIAAEFAKHETGENVYKTIFIAEQNI